MYVRLSIIRLKILPTVGTTKDVQHYRLYRQWSDFYSTLLVNPTLQDYSLPWVNILQVYRHRVLHALYSKQNLDQLEKELVSHA